MKHLFSLLSFLVIAGLSTLSAQTDTGPMWGIRAAFDVNIPGKWHFSNGGHSVKMYKQGYGGSLGAMCNLYLGKGFFLEPGASVFYDSYSYDNLTILNSTDSSDGIFDPTIYKVGLRVPLVVGYTFGSDKFSMSVYTGPEASVAFTGKVRVDDIPDTFEFDNNIFGPDGQSRFDLAWKIGMSVPFDAWTISIDGAIGITDLYRTGVIFRENRVSVGLTRYF
ncbi:MAG: PorT family protein [Muribaculaceae bacterium]|nr:PorT family protein [Muribaculaceae bacterium]